MEELNIIWEEALGKAKIRESSGRRWYKEQCFTHFTWNLYHPEDLKITNDGMVIHHKDLNPLNDHISNLQKMTISEHVGFHASNRSEETIKKISENTKGEGNPMFGRHPSEETIRKMSDAQKGEKNHMFGRTGEKGPAARAVLANYKEYSTMNGAAKFLKVHPTTVWYRIKVGKPGYKYL